MNQRSIVSLIPVSELLIGEGVGALRKEEQPEKNGFHRLMQEMEQEKDEL